MGRIGKFIEFLRGGKFDSVQIDIGGGDNRTAQIFAPIGDDSQPLPTDYALTIDIPGAGRKAVIAWIDPETANTSEPGARRFYSRNPDKDGAIAAELTLANDGGISLKNEFGSMELLNNGNVKINGCIIYTDGSIFSPGTIEAATDVVGGDVSLKDHTHDYIDTVDGAPTSATTEGPN